MTTTDPLAGIMKTLKKAGGEMLESELKKQQYPTSPETTKTRITKLVAVGWAKRSRIHKGDTINQNVIVLTEAGKQNLK